MVEFCLDGRILPVSAVALDGYVPVPCRRSRAFEGLGFAEAMPGGLFVMVPLALAALACPFLRKRMRVRGHAGMWPTLVMFLLLGLLIVALDARLEWPWMALYRRFRLAVCVGFASFDAYCAGLRTSAASLAVARAGVGAAVVHVVVDGVVVVPVRPRRRD